jgi:hypothetical protein
MRAPPWNTSLHSMRAVPHRTGRLLRELKRLALAWRTMTENLFVRRGLGEPPRFSSPLEKRFREILLFSLPCIALAHQFIAIDTRGVTTI